MASQKAPKGKVTKSLRTTLIVFVVGLVVTTSVLFSASSLFMQTMNVNSQINKIADRHVNLLNAISPGVASSLNPGARGVLTTIVRESDSLAGVWILDSAGDVVFEATGENATSQQYARLIERARNQGAPVRHSTSRSMIVSAPIFETTGVTGWYVFEIPFSAAWSNWLNTLLWGLATGCLISALILPVVFLMVDRLMKPLRRLISFASEVNGQRLSSRIELDSGNEFDLLGDAFNSMMHRMESTMKQIQRLAFMDSVTDLPNREAFIRSLARALDSRPDDQFTAVILLNVDRFRWVNETLGPQKGDEALSLIGLRIRKALAAADKHVRLNIAAEKPSMVARLSGDEFAVLIPSIDAKSDISRLMQLIISSMRQPLEIEGHSITLGLSGGIALAPIHGLSVEELIKNADLALKEARRAGRSKARFYSTKLNRIAMDRMHLEADLRRGIERDEFSPYFQAKVDFKTGLISGAEALVRWQRDDGDLISPGIFIPMAEQLGLISSIGETVLRKSCIEAARWMKSGHDCKVAVNVSPLQFEEADFAEKVLSALRDAGLPPGRLELEITETMAVADTDRVSEIMRPLRAMGVRLAIDDFGAGHSNLVTLTKLPFDVFKIDQQFVSALHSDKQAPAVVEMILAMAETMGLETVAEGVETPSQSDFLRRRGCTLAQGYLYSKPVPPDEFIEFLADWRPFGQDIGEDVIVHFTGTDSQPRLR